MTDKIWTRELLEDPDSGDLIVELPEEILALNGWTEGTRLKWLVNPDGTVTLTEIKE